jgi:hypothetical protein
MILLGGTYNLKHSFRTSLSKPVLMYTDVPQLGPENNHLCGDKSDQLLAITLEGDSRIVKANSQGMEGTSDDIPFIGYLSKCQKLYLCRRQL